MAISIITGLLSLTSIATAQSINLRPQAVPSGRYSDFIDPSYAGFGIEPSNLFSFTGYDKPNKLSFNLIDTLTNYTGAPPHLRLGGNTQDYMVFDEGQQQYTWINNPNATGQGNFATDSMLIGPKFFEVVNRFPYGTPVTWGLNLAYTNPDYQNRIVQMAQQAVDNLPNIKLVSFEIGNEPDLYLGNGFRTGSWGGQVYAQQWTNRAQVIYDRVLKPLNITPNFFEPGTTANTIGTSFQIKDMLELGIGANANNTDGRTSTFISSWNQHDYYYFIGVTKTPLTLEEFMTLQTTNTQFRAWEEQIEQSNDTPYPYALREMCSVGPIGMEGVTNTFGAALWTLNFFLYTATLNITSVQMHMTDNSNASAWQPLEMYGRQPFVRPLYYGYAAFAQILGPTCTTQIAPLDLGPQPQSYNGMIKTYSIYQSGNLSTIVIINARMANVSEPTKDSLSVTLTLPTSLAGQDLHLAYLSAPGADATSGTVWNGISYERSGDGTPETIDTTDRTVRIGPDGTATLQVRDSEALAARIGSRVGEGEPDRTACAAIAARSQAIGPTPVTSGVEGQGGSSGSGSGGGSGTTDGAQSRTGGSATGTPTGAAGRRAVGWSSFVAALAGVGMVLL
ncbi:Glycosyl hydrolase family 79 C-terminal beta domain-containing protein 1 [Elsinoe fawcettii]|nr:Glycosyl hydrolase family 79 C-terminal beta domain-containing protein 1 [Elsinoe fawcettii]